MFQLQYEVRLKRMYGAVQISELRALVEECEKEIEGPSVGYNSGSSMYDGTPSTKEVNNLVIEMVRANPKRSEGETG